MLRPARLRALLDGHGGFTLDPRSGATMHHGVSVCTEPQRSLRLAGWDAPMVAGWLATHHGAYLQPGCYVGGWRDPATGDDWLDVVRVLPSSWLAAALDVARRHGQRGVFDLSCHELVRVRAS